MLGGLGRSASREGAPDGLPDPADDPRQLGHRDAESDAAVRLLLFQRACVGGRVSGASSIIRTASSCSRRESARFCG